MESYFNESSGNAAVPFRSTPLPLATLDRADAKFVYDYWSRKRGDRRMPARADIDPLEIKSVLPQVVLIDVQRQPLDFRFRLAGTRSYDIFGFDLTGRSVREIEPRDWSEGIWKSFSELARTGEPQHVRLDFCTTEGYARSFSVLRLPLGDDGITVDRILALNGLSRDKYAAGP